MRGDRQGKLLLMIRQILEKVLLSRATQHEELNTVRERLRSSEGVDLTGALMNAIETIEKTGDKGLLDQLVKSLSHINNPDGEREVLDLLTLFLQKYHDEIPGALRVLISIALTLWKKAINKYDVNSKNSNLPPSLDKYKKSKQQQTAEQSGSGEPSGIPEDVEPGEPSGSPEGDQSTESSSTSLQGDPWDQTSSENESGHTSAKQGQTVKRKPGGQPGHEGHTKKWMKPDKVEKYEKPPLGMPENARRIDDEVHQCQEVRSITEVTEYRVARWRDSKGRIYKAETPDEIQDKLKAPVQYGSRVKAICVDDFVRNAIAYQRTSERFLSEHLIRISQGSLRNFLREAARLLRQLGFEAWIKAYLTYYVHVLHVDETGVNIGKLLEWVHICCTELVTYVYAHDKRGFEAILDMGILTELNPNTVIVHDCWASYFAVECLHALCGSHLIRELLKAYSQDHLEWVNELITLLIRVNEYKLEKGALSDEEFKLLETRYREILERGKKQIEEYKTKYGNQKIKSETLLKRLEKRESEYLRFAKDAEVPFTNNTAERGFRMLKNRMKIGGCFRNFESAQDYMLVFSYIETCRKQGLLPIDALEMLFNNKLPDFVDLSII